MVKNLLKKIIPLAVAFVLAFVAVFFSVHSAPAFAGAGNGKSATVKDPEGVAERMSSLPSSSYYFNGMYEDDDEFKGATLHETCNLSQSSYMSSSSSDNYGYDRNMRAHRDMDVYFGKTGVYYSANWITVTQSTEHSGDRTTYSTGTQEIAADLYITAGKVFMNLRKLEVVEDVRVYEDGELVVEEEEEDDGDFSEADLSAEAQKMWQSVVRKNPNAWVALSNYNLDDLENGDFDEDDFEDMLEGTKDMNELYARTICMYVSQALQTSYMQQNDSNVQELQRIGASLSNNDLFTKSGNVYTLEGSMLGSGITMVDCSNATAPKIYYSYSNHNSSEYGGSTSSSISETIEITNLDNTVLPAVPSSPKDMYAYIGNGVKNLIKKYGLEL